MRTTKIQPLPAVDMPTHRRGPDREEPRLIRWLPLIIVGLGLLAVAAAILFTRLTTDRVEQAETDTANTAAQASNLADQISVECAAGRLAGPICAQAATVAADPVPGPRGEQGEQGERGPMGPMGPMGPAGRDGVDGRTPPCLDTPTQCVGPPGRDGVDGQDGADGADGQDGRDGSPAVRMVKTFDDGTVETCERSGGPDTAPEYDCSVTTPPTTSAPPTTTTSAPENEVEGLLPP